MGAQVKRRLKERVQSKGEQAAFGHGKMSPRVGVGRQTPTLFLAQVSQNWESVTRQIGFYTREGQYRSSSSTLS